MTLRGYCLKIWWEFRFFLRISSLLVFKHIFFSKLNVDCRFVVGNADDDDAGRLYFHHDNVAGRMRLLNKVGSFSYTHLTIHYSQRFRRPYIYLSLRILRCYEMETSSMPFATSIDRLYWQWKAIQWWRGSPGITLSRHMNYKQAKGNLNNYCLSM